MLVKPPASLIHFSERMLSRRKKGDSNSWSFRQSLKQEESDIFSTDHINVGEKIWSGKG